MEIKQIQIGKIKPSPMNPRKTFNEEDINELANNIESQGLLQPITVRPIEFTDELDEEQVLLCLSQQVMNLYAVNVGLEPFHCSKQRKMKRTSKR